MSHANDLRDARLVELRAKLKARESNPGFASNIALMKKQIDALERDLVFRHVETKQFVSVEFAIQNPETAEVVEPTV